MNNKQMTADDQENTWLELAELFFLDTEHPESFYIAVSQKLKERGLSKERVAAILKEEVAPIAGANLGYLIYPVIGEWGAFDKAALCNKIRPYVNRRSVRPRWFYFLQDLWCKKMLDMLEADKLLSLLS